MNIACNIDYPLFGQIIFRILLSHVVVLVGWLSNEISKFNYEFLLVGE